MTGADDKKAYTESCSFRVCVKDTLDIKMESEKHGQLDALLSLVFFSKNGSKKRENPKLRVFYSHCIQFCLNWQTYPAQLWWDDSEASSLGSVQKFYDGDLWISLLLIDIPSLHPTELRTLKKN